MVQREDGYQPVDGEGVRYEVGDLGGAGQDTDFGKARGNAARDLRALPFFQFDVDLWMGCHPGASRAGRNSVTAAVLAKMRTLARIRLA